MALTKHISSGGTLYYLPGSCLFKEGDYVVIERDSVFGGLFGVVYETKDEMVTLHVPEWGEVQLHHSKLRKVED